ncbi:MAG: heme exporter protein CcmD [Alphaproteobacteria bacterium]|nr:heme exporter protein CcmD [Alphaproteobacteria bacterium]
MSEFFAMGGYAFFVWSSYAVVVAGLGTLAGASWLARRRALAALDAQDGDSP